MAHVARRRGLPVETTTFEAWHPGGRGGSISIISADAWHWVNPAQGARKAAQILRPAAHRPFLSFHVLDDPDIEELSTAHRKHAPSPGGRRPAEEHGRCPGSAGDGEDFVAVAQRDYRWSLALNADEWIGLISTFSDHHRMAPTDRSALFDRVREVIGRAGRGTVRTTSGTLLR